MQLLFLRLQKATKVQLSKVSNQGAARDLKFRRRVESFSSWAFRNRTLQCYRASSTSKFRRPLHPLRQNQEGTDLCRRSTAAPAGGLHCTIGDSRDFGTRARSTLQASLFLRRP